MSDLSDIIQNWDDTQLQDGDRVYDSKGFINNLTKAIPLLGKGVIQMKTSTRNLMINGLPLDGKLYKGTGSASSGIVEVVPEGTDYVYHMAKNGTTQGAWSISSTDSSSISQIPYVKEDVLFANTLIKGSGTATMQFLDKDNSVLSEMTTPVLTSNYQAFNVKGQLKDSIWSFRIVASDAIYFKQVMITRSSFPSDYMLSEEELEQLNIINTSNIDANTVTKSHAYQVIGLKNCPDNVSTSGLFITIQKDNFAQVFVPNNDTGIYYRVGVTTNRPNTKWTRLATSDNTYSKEDFTEMRTSDNINLIQDSSMSAGFWAFTKAGASTSVGSMDTAEGIAHITGNGTSGTLWAQYQVTNQNYQQPLIQNSEIQYDQDYTVSVETTWSDGADIASNDEVLPSLIVRENYKDGTSKDIVHVKAVDKYGYNKWHKLSGTFNFSENRKNDISFIQVILVWKGAKGDVYFRRPKLEMASLPSTYTDDTVVSVEPNHNLLQDSRDLLDGWKMNGSKVSLDATGDMAWYQGMRVQHLFGDWSYYGTTKTPVLENGKYYTVSAYMRGLSEADINMYATILSDKSNSSSINFPLAKHLTGEWRRYSYTFKFDANTQVANTSTIRVEGQGDWASNGGSVYVAGIKLEEGKTATDWSPSIEETIVRYETQNWQKDKITADNGDLALRVNVSGTDPMDKQFLSATGTKTFYLQDGATGNNTGDSLRGILIKDSPTYGNAYGINNKNELWFLKIQDSKLTAWSKVATTGEVAAEFAEVIDARNGKGNLKTRLDDEHAQVTEQLAQNVEHLTELRINVKKIPKGINYEGSPLESITNEFVSQTGKIERIISYYKTVYNSGFTLYFPVGNYYFVDFPLHNEVNISGSGKRSTKFIPLENSSIDHFFYVATAPVGWCTYENFSVIGLSNDNQNPIKNPNQSCFKMEAKYFGTRTGGVWNCVFNRIHITGFAKYGFEWISSPTTQGDMANQFNSFNEVEVHRINSLESRCIKGGGNQFTYNNCMMDNELSGSDKTLGVGTNIETNGVCTFVLLTSQNSEKAIEFSTGNLTLVNPWFENVGKSITATGLDPLINIEGGYFGNAGFMPDGSGYLFKQIGMKAIINVKGAFFVGKTDNVYIEADVNQGGIYLTKCRGPKTSISRKTQQVSNGDGYFGYAKTVLINSGGLIQTIPVIETEEMITYIAFAGGVTVKTGGNIKISKDIVLNTAGDSITLVKTDRSLPYHVVSIFKQSIFI